MPRFVRFAFTALCLACCTAWAQPSALSHIEGSVALSTQGDDEWTDVRQRRALRERDRLWTDPASRAELQAGTHLLRLDARSHLTLDKLQPAQVSLRRGSLQARLAPTSGDGQVEIDTPNLALRASGPAQLRVDVDAQRGVTQVSVAQGNATLFGDKGQKRELQAGQSASFAGRALMPAAAVRPVTAADDFERWIQARERGGASPTSTMGAAVAPRALNPRAPREPEPRQAQRDAPRSRPAAAAPQQQRHQAWVRQQRDLSERWRREHEEWLRWQEGGPPPASMRQQQGIPARRVG